jgi:hypothetical protein
MGLGGAPDNFKSMKAWSYPPIIKGHQESRVPVDEFNDACKALAYGLVENFGYATDIRPPLGPMNYINPGVPAAPTIEQEIRAGGAWSRQTVPAGRTGLWKVRLDKKP